MKNSTAKPVKKQGPIRFEAIVPLAIVVGLIVAYFSLFFDTHLRRGLEYAATQGNGAEVDIATVKTSVFDASVQIAGVQMTDPAQPMQNRVEIGQVRFRMLWDALLRGKVMIDEAVIEDVQVATVRQRAGYVLPPEPEDDGPSATDKMLDQMKQEFSGNAVGDLAAIAAGADPSGQLKVAGSDLKSGAFLDELKKSQDEMEQQWRERIAALPKNEDFNALRTRLSKVQTKDFKDVTQVQASVKELQAIRDEFDAMSKPVGEAGGKLGGDMGKLRTSFTDLEKVMREDVQGLQSRLKLPSLDAATLSRALFGMDVLGKLQQGKGYMEQARQYMPAKGAKKVAPKQIHKGHDYAFGRPKAYPAFWLRRAAVTSTLPGGKGLSGEILDVASDQALTGKPMQALLKGNFPQQGINGVKAELLVDHRNKVPLERLRFEVGSYALAGRTLVDSDSVKLAFSKADVASGVSGELRGDKVDLRMSSRFGAAAFETSAKTAVVREMMTASLSGLDAVTMDARVSGTWSDLDWRLSSNLGDAMVKGMGRYLQAKMDEAKKRIQAMVDAQIGEQRQRLQARQKEIESQLKDALAKPQAQVDKLRGELDAARKDLDKRKNAVVDTQKQKLNQEAGKLLDKFRR